MFDTEKLIQEIRVRDLLWNMNSKSYLNKLARRTAWEEIGAAMEDDWHTFTTKQKDERVNYFIKKWTNVRDYYMRARKRAKNNSITGLRRMKRYHYHNSLKFLDAVKPRKRRSSLSDSQELMENTVEYLEDTSNDMVTYEHCADEDRSISESPQYIKLEDEATTPKSTFETHIMSPLDKSQVDTNETASKNFLLSLLPDVTSLNERQNMKFRLGVLNMINDIKFGQK